ncbi:hypothetical protein ACS0TY_019992 [Phlomoides rotata]
MVLLVQKLGRSLKFPSMLENRPLNSHTLSESLRNFRSKIWDFITQNLLKPDQESNFLSLTGFNTCFQLIHTTNSAFAKLVVEIDYPMSRWGAKLTEDYLTYTLNLMELLNAVNSSVSHLRQAKLSLHHAVSLLQNSPSSDQSKHLKNIPPNTLIKELKFERPVKVVQEKSGCDQESVLLQALIVSKKIGFLALGFVVSGLCGDAKPYMDVRKFSGGFDDSVIKDLDSRFCKEVGGIMGEVKGVNNACAVVSTGRCSDEPVDELKRRLKVLENSIQIIEKQSNNLFSQVLSERNKLLDNFRFSG